MTMHYLFILFALLCLEQSLCSVYFPTMDLAYRGAQLTPRGRDHPVNILNNIPIVFESPQIPVEYYAGKVLMMAYRPYWDLDVCNYENNLGVTCIIITSTNPYTPGSNINKGFNNCTYSCAFEMLYPDFQAFAEEYKLLMEATNNTAQVTVNLDGSEGNQWKSMVYSPLYMFTIVFGGLCCVAFIVWNLINNIRIRIYGLEKYKRWIWTTSLIICSGIVGIVGFADFNCFLQIMPYRMCNVFSGVRPPFVYAASNLFTFGLMEAIKDQVGQVEYKLPKRFWIYALTSFLYLAMEIICGTVISYLTDYDQLITLLTIWLALELGYITYTAIIDTILSVQTIIKLNQLSKATGNMSNRNKRIKNTMIILLSKSSATICYVVIVGITNEAVFYPWFLGSTWLVYNLLLTYIAFIMTFIMNGTISKNIKSSKKISKSNSNSKENGSDRTTEMSNTTSTITQNPELSRRESKLLPTV